MTRLYESRCVYCKAYAVLSGYCRQCESNNPVIDEPKECDAPTNNSDDSEQSSDTTVFDIESD